MRKTAHFFQKTSYNLIKIHYCFCLSPDPDSLLFEIIIQLFEKMLRLSRNTNMLIQWSAVFSP